MNNNKISAPKPLPLFNVTQKSNVITITTYITNEMQNFLFKESDFSYIVSKYYYKKYKSSYLCKVTYIFRKKNFI